MKQRRRRYYLRHMSRRGLVDLHEVRNYHGTVRLHATPKLAPDTHLGSPRLRGLDRDSIIGMGILAQDPRSLVSLGDLVHTGEPPSGSAADFVERGMEIVGQALEAAEAAKGEVVGA